MKHLAATLIAVLMSVAAVGAQTTPPAPGSDPDITTLEIKNSAQIAIVFDISLRSGHQLGRDDAWRRNERHRLLSKRDDSDELMVSAHHRGPRTAASRATWAAGMEESPRDRLGSGARDAVHPVGQRLLDRPG